MKNEIINELKKAGLFAEKGTLSLLPEIIEKRIEDVRSMGIKKTKEYTTLGTKAWEIVLKLA